MRNRERKKGEKGGREREEEQKEEKEEEEEESVSHPRKGLKSKLFLVFETKC